MSTRPWMKAPSCIEIRAMAKSPNTDPVLLTSIRSWALALPFTLPCTTSSRAAMSALTAPLGPTVTNWPGNWIEPSTSPSMKMSSVPLILPLKRMVLPICDESRRVVEVLKRVSFQNPPFYNRRTGPAEDSCRYFAIPPAAALARHAPMEALLALARLDCALADADLDHDAVAAACLQAAAACLGHAPLPPPPAGHGLRDPLAAPQPEGPRFYGLDPLGFAAAARRWARRAAGREVFILGLRSMGSVLAPIVAAALAAEGMAAAWTTLRPAGPPFARWLEAPAALGRRLSGFPGAFLVVDEGPGLSGSSFGAAFSLLASLAVPSRRITLLASWAPTPEQAARLCHPGVAAAWPGWN